jgi:hypothetical protein
MSTTLSDPLRSILTSSSEALRRVAGYTLPAALDRRILELGERKETLTETEREELLAWVEFTQERSIEKFQAESALRQLESVQGA